MATEIAFSTTVDTGEGAKSIRSLKNEFKETQKELDGLTVGSEKYVATLSKLGKIKDDIGDLNAEIKAFNPEGKVQAFGTVVNGVASGFQAATGAAALFGSENKDLEKTLVKLQAVMAFTDGIKGLASLGDGFKVLSNVIKANPIFLIVGVVASVGTALFALKDKIGVVGDAFDFLGDIIGTVVQGFKDFTDWIGITSNASDDFAEQTIANAKKVGQATSDRYDLEIAKAQAAGKTTFELEKQKQEAIIKTLRVEAEAIVAAAKARGNFTDEENARFTELIALTQKAANEITIIDIKANKERSDEQEKATAKNKTELDKRKADRIKHEEDLNKLREAQDQYEELQRKKKLEADNAQKASDNEAIAEATKMLDDYQRDLLARAELKAIQNESDLQAQIEFLEAKKSIELENEELTQGEKLLIEEKYAQQKKDLTLKYEKEKVDATFAIAQASNQSLQSLSDLFFSLKQKNLKKGSAEELKAAKQQFKINKALAIQSSIISGIQGVINALSAQSVIPEPYGTILKVANAVSVGIATAANVAKIASTQFSEGGGGSVPTIDAPSSPAAPTINAPSTSTTSLNPDGTVANTQNQQPIVIQNNIVESDITNTQHNVATIQQSALIG